MPIRTIAAGAVVAMLAIIAPPTPASGDDFARQRVRLVAELQADADRVRLSTGRQPFRAEVLEAIGTVPRHLFVPERERHRAYRNRPLPIGHGQTISQPYIVALMTDLIEPLPGQKVLEIGTGSGYQAAVLAALGLEVYSIEIIEPLARAAGTRLQRLGYDRVRTRWGDGYDGWPEQAPFDAIVVTAAASHIPPPLLRQLKPGGRMVIPVGARFVTQQLVLVRKAADGRITTRQMLPVAFVPFTRQTQP